jgi:phage tail-like protein
MPSSPGPLLNHLPAIYHTSAELCTLLAVFEAVLYGGDGQGLEPERRQPSRRQSLSEILPIVDSIATIASLFDAYETPKELVPWLAQWVALSHLSGLSEQRQRELLAKIVPLYAQRGTKQYLERLLEFFKPENATVAIEDQELGGFVVGTVTVGLDSRLERDRPFWFRVQIHASMPVGDPDTQRELRRQWDNRLRRVIDLAKPVHTLYELDWQFEESQEGN